MDLGPYLRAHSYLRVQRPFALWLVDVDDVALIRLTGELLAVALGRGTELGDVVMHANNVTVPDDSPVAAGDYVAITIAGAGDWSPEVSWTPHADRDQVLVSDDVTRAARAAGIPWAYTRVEADGGSVTFMLPRAAA